MQIGFTMPNLAGAFRVLHRFAPVHKVFWSTGITNNYISMASNHMHVSYRPDVTYPSDTSLLGDAMGYNAHVLYEFQRSQVMFSMQQNLMQHRRIFRPILISCGASCKLVKNVLTDKVAWTSAGAT